MIFFLLAIAELLSNLVNLQFFEAKAITSESVASSEVSDSIFNESTLELNTPKGHVLRIVDIINETWTLNENNLSDVIGEIPIGMEVAVASIAGEYRSGKSFLMNFFLQYLDYKSRNGHQHGIWIHDVEKNSGFQFKSGTIRETKGINIWSEPFIVKNKEGKNVAVLVMDSQGLYDQKTSKDDNIKIFTMVTLLSSTTMVNTLRNINFNQLSQLKYFLDYAAANSQSGDGLKLLQRTIEIKEQREKSDPKKQNNDRRVKCTKSKSCPTRV
jgi:hypothetical protein